MILLAAAGAEFVNGYVSGPNGRAILDEGVYQMGQSCYDYLYDFGQGAFTDFLDLCSDWLFSSNRRKPFTIPADVLNAIHTWGFENGTYDFSNPVVLSKQGIVDDNGRCFLFTDLVHQPATVGSIVQYDPNDDPWDDVFGTDVDVFFGPYQLRAFWRWSVDDDNNETHSVGTAINFYKSEVVDLHPYTNVVGKKPMGLYGLVLSYEASTDKVYARWYRYEDGTCAPFSKYRDAYFYGSSLVKEFNSTVTFDIPSDDEETVDVAIKIPDSIPYVDSVYSLDRVPFITELAPSDILVRPGEEAGEGEDDEDIPIVPPIPGTGVTSGEITQAITDALPITGSIAGDDVVEEVLEEPLGVGGAFITRFPFSIPWDVAKAIELLVAPPVPPRFEFDMFAALDGFGGFHGDGTVVLDFEIIEPLAVIVRWATMVGFVYLLAVGTKKLIWTA